MKICKQSTEMCVFTLASMGQRLSRISDAVNAEPSSTWFIGGTPHIHSQQTGDSQVNWGRTFCLALPFDSDHRLGVATARGHQRDWL